jgi:hypothetical protein
MKNSNRLHYMDNARALASVLGIFFHASLVFSGIWLVTVPADQRSVLLGELTGLLTHFRMPLFL